MQARRLLARLCHVFSVATAELVNAIGCQFQHAVRERGQEVAVMRHEQHGALEFRQRCNQQNRQPAESGSELYFLSIPI